MSVSTLMPKRKSYALKVFDGSAECVSGKEQRMLRKHKVDEEGVKVYVFFSRVGE